MYSSVWNSVQISFEAIWINHQSCCYLWREGENLQRSYSCRASVYFSAWKHAPTVGCTQSRDPEHMAFSKMDFLHLAFEVRRHAIIIIIIFFVSLIVVLLRSNKSGLLCLHVELRMVLLSIPLSYQFNKATGLHHLQDIFFIWITNTIVVKLGTSCFLHGHFGIICEWKKNKCANLERLGKKAVLTITHLLNL